MHTYAIDIVRQNGERAQARAERTGHCGSALPPGAACAVFGVAPGPSGDGAGAGGLPAAPQASPASRRR